MPLTGGRLSFSRRERVGIVGVIFQAFLPLFYSLSFFNRIGLNSSTNDGVAMGEILNPSPP